MVQVLNPTSRTKLLFSLVSTKLITSMNLVAEGGASAQVSYNHNPTTISKKGTPLFTRNSFFPTLHRRAFLLFINSIRNTFVFCGTKLLSNNLYYNLSSIHTLPYIHTFFINYYIMYFDKKVDR